MEKIGAPLFFRKLRKLTTTPPPPPPTPSPPIPFKKVVGGSNDEVVNTVLQKSIRASLFSLKLTMNLLSSKISGIQGTFSSFNNLFTVTVAFRTHKGIPQAFWNFFMIYNFWSFNESFFSLRILLICFVVKVWSFFLIWKKVFEDVHYGLIKKRHLFNVAKIRKGFFPNIDMFIVLD